MRSILTKTFIALAVLAAAYLAWWLQQPGQSHFFANGEAGAGGAGSASAAPVARAAPLIEAVRARAAALRDEVQAVGTLVSRQNVSLRSQSSGRVTQIHFKDGQRVRKGQVLIQQDDQLQRAELQQVQAELNLARANHQRNQELVAKGFISQRGLDESSAALQVAEARLALARTTVERLQLKAPFDAVAGIGNVSVGDYLREGDEVIGLQDIDVLHVDFRLPERYLPQVAVGQTAQFQVDALPGESFTARLAAIDPLINEQGRSIAIRASLNNEAHRLRPGMFARIALVLEERPDAVVVPEEAVLSSADGAAIIRLAPWDEAARGGDPTSLPPDAAFRSERVPVQLGLRQPGWVEVRGGAIAAGDVVMTAGQHRVNTSGQRVRLAWTGEDAATNAAVNAVTGATTNAAIKTQ